MSNNIQRVNEYYIGNGTAIAVLEQEEHECDILNNSDTVTFISELTLDFDDITNDRVKAFNGKSYYTYPFVNPAGLYEALKFLK